MIDCLKSQFKVQPCTTINKNKHENYNKKLR